MARRASVIHWRPRRPPPRRSRPPPPPSPPAASRRLQRLVGIATLASICAGSYVAAAASRTCVSQSPHPKVHRHRKRFVLSIRLDALVQGARPRQLRAELRVALVPRCRDDDRRPRGPDTRPCRSLACDPVSRCGPPNTISKSSKSNASSKRLRSLSRSRTSGP